MAAVDAVIIGGGPAGSVAAALLARAGYSVRLFEKQNVPRHKLCGEFLSPEALNVVRQIPGVVESISENGRLVSSVVLSAGGVRSVSPLPLHGTAMTRHRLDALLFESAAACGTEMRSGVAVQDVRGSLDEGFQVDADGELVRARIIIGAFGRLSSIERSLDRDDAGRPSPFVALKQYFHSPVDSDAVELHAVGGGYCGVVNVEPDIANVCCMVRTDVLKRSGGAGEFFAYLKDRNQWLNRRLGESADILARPLAVSNLHFHPRARFHRDICLVGDAAGMIAPLCGDGMAMAVGSGNLAAAHAASFLQRKINAAQFRQGYAADWDNRFGSTMWKARQLQRIFVGSRGVASLGVLGTRLVPGLVARLFRATRGEALTETAIIATPMVSPRRLD